MVLPEGLQQTLVADDLGVVDDDDGLGVTGETGAHLLVGGVRGVAAGVADEGGVDAVELPELALDTPEAAHGEHGGLHARRATGRSSGWPLTKCASGTGIVWSVRPASASAAATMEAFLRKSMQSGYESSVKPARSRQAAQRTVGSGPSRGRSAQEEAGDAARGDGEADEREGGEHGEVRRASSSPVGRG